MIKIKQIQTIGKKIEMHEIKGENRTINGQHLFMLPALIDPHVHFRVPGAEHKEDWITAAKAAIAGGVTTVFDMPNTTPPCNTKKRLEEKKQRIERQLQIPLRYALYFGADQNHLEEILKVKKDIIGLKIYMGSSTGSLLMTDPKALDKVFQIASENDLLVAVHAEDEELIQQREAIYKKDFQKNVAIHSLIRSPEVAQRATERAIEMAAKYNTRLYLVHVSTKEELDLIRQAKKDRLNVYAETTPHHLFLNTALYETLETLALVNPPLREKADAVWEAIDDNTIDTIGTDHAPHLIEEKKLPIGKAPSGFPSIELYLSLLLNAHFEKKLSLKQIAFLTSKRAREIFQVPDTDDVVLVDLNCTRTVNDEQLKTKAKWSPYRGLTLRGWPCHTILRGRVFDVDRL